MRENRSPGSVPGSSGNRYSYGDVATVWLPTAEAQETTVVDPNALELGPYRHQELPAELLTRIRAVTDAFQRIDGVSYEEAVDLYRRDVDPESNLVLWEEMVRAYEIFCESRCTRDDERKDVYQALLLRTMFPEEQAIAQLRPVALTREEAREVMQLYRLPAAPITVITDG